MIPISVCIITKNEEKHMEEFLSRIRPYPWEIIVVDTGSNDRTREIAEKYADKVLDFTWINDFSAARNFSISHASHDFILVLDCDEYLTQIDLEKIYHLMEEHPERIGCIERHSHFDSNEKDTVSVDFVERLFRKDLFHYQHPIHEQVVSITHTPYIPYHLPLVTEHHGYNLTEEGLKAKAERNNTLLFEWLEKEPDNAYVLFQIGQSFFMLDEYEKAYPYFKKSILLEAKPCFPYVNILVISYGYCLLYTGRLEEAMKLLERYDTFSFSCDFCCLSGSIYLENNYPIKAMGEFIKAMQCDTFFVKDAKFNIPVYNIGYVNELLGDTKSALMHYHRCKGFPMAEERIASLEA